MTGGGVGVNFMFDSFARYPIGEVRVSWADNPGPVHHPNQKAGVADHLSRRASSLSPARDSLLKKGLVFSAQRGQIAFTVPHFGRYLLANGA